MAAPWLSSGRVTDAGLMGHSSPKGSEKLSELPPLPPQPKWTQELFPALETIQAGVRTAAKANFFTISFPCLSQSSILEGGQHF